MEGLLDSRGNWVGNNSRMSKFVRDYFFDLFHSECSNDAEQVLRL